MSSSSFFTPWTYHHISALNTVKHTGQSLSRSTAVDIFQFTQTVTCIPSSIYLTVATDSFTLPPNSPLYDSALTTCKYLYS